MFSARLFLLFDTLSQSNERTNLKLMGCFWTAMMSRVWKAAYTAAWWQVLYLIRLSDSDKHSNCSFFSKATLCQEASQRSRSGRSRIFGFLQAGQKIAMSEQVGRVSMGFEHGSVARWVALKGMSHLNIMYSLWQFLDTERWALLALYTCDGERGEVRKRRERQGTFRKKSQTRSI